MDDDRTIMRKVARKAKVIRPEVSDGLTKLGTVYMYVCMYVTA